MCVLSTTLPHVKSPTSVAAANFDTSVARYFRFKTKRAQRSLKSSRWAQVWMFETSVQTSLKTSALRFDVLVWHPWQGWQCDWRGGSLTCERDPHHQGKDHVLGESSSNNSFGGRPWAGYWRTDSMSKGFGDRHRAWAYDVNVDFNSHCLAVFITLVVGFFYRYKLYLDLRRLHDGLRGDLQHLLEEHTQLSNESSMQHMHVTAMYVGLIRAGGYINLNEEITEQDSDNWHYMSRGETNVRTIATAEGIFTGWEKLEDHVDHSTPGRSSAEDTAPEDMTEEEYLNAGWLRVILKTPSWTQKKVSAVNAQWVQRSGQVARTALWTAITSISDWAQGRAQWRRSARRRRRKWGRTARGQRWLWCWHGLQRVLEGRAPQVPDELLWWISWPCSAHCMSDDPRVRPASI